MSEENDLKQDLGTDVRHKSPHKRSNFINYSQHRRNNNQIQRNFNGHSEQQQPRGRDEEHQQQQVRILNGQHHQRHGNAGACPPLPHYFRRPLIDPVIREERRLFYQNHYQNRNDEHGTRQRTNYSRQRNRSFRNRNAQSNQQKDAQCDNKKEQKPGEGENKRNEKDERPVRQENGSADPGSQTCPPEKNVTEAPANHMNAHNRMDGRNGRNRYQQHRHRSAGSNKIVSHPPPGSGPGQSEERGMRKAVRPHRAGRSRGTVKQNSPDAKAETRDAIPEKTAEVEKEAEVVEEEEVGEEEDETKCCPLCTEPLDPTECNLYPCCFCKFQICLFCLNRLKQEDISSEQQQPQPVDQQAERSQKRVCGSCPGCRNPYTADSDDESMTIAVRMTKKQTKGGTEKTGNRNRNTNWKQETRPAEKTTDNRSQGNRSQPLLLMQQQAVGAAKRQHHENDHRHHQHHTHQGKETAVNYQSEKATDCIRAADRLRGSSHSSPLTSHSKVRVRGHGRRVRDSRSGITSADPDRGADQKRDAGSIKTEESASGQKQELVSLLSSLGLSACNIHFNPQRQES